MRKLTLATWLFLTLAIGAIELVGRQQHIGARLAMLRFTDCAAPCWIGIAPGRTTVDEARAILTGLKARPLIEHLDRLLEQEPQAPSGRRARAPTAQTATEVTRTVG